MAQQAAKLVLSTIYTAPADGGHRFAVAGIGELRLEIDGELSTEAIAPQANDPMVVFSQPFESGCERDLRTGQRLRLTATGRPGDYEPGFVRFRLAAQTGPADPARTGLRALGHRAARVGPAQRAIRCQGRPVLA